MSMSDKVIVKQAFDILDGPIEEVDESVVNKELEKKSVNLVTISDNFKGMVGRVLTIIDASVTDKEQKKAMKDLIKAEIYDTEDSLFALAD